MTSATAPFVFTEWHQRVGIEREYKWSLQLEDAQQLLAGRSMEQALDDITLPAGFRPNARKGYRHEQQTAYLDDGWLLLDHEASLAVVINLGPTGEQTYLKTKQTIGWHHLRRDAIELAERVAFDDVPAAIAECDILPLTYLTRQFGDLSLRPFARTLQQRWKLSVYSPLDAPMVICWDECAISAVDVGASETAHCIELETNMLDERSCAELAELADAVSEFLRMPPNSLSKSRRAAALCGHDLSPDDHG